MDEEGELEHVLSSTQQHSSSSSLPFSSFRGEGNCNSALAGSPQVGSMSSRGAERYSYACCPFHPIICKILPPARSAYRIPAVCRSVLGLQDVPRSRSVTSRILVKIKSPLTGPGWRRIPATP